MVSFFQRNGRFDKMLSAIERICMGIAITAALVVMVAVSLDATLRYGFDSPITGVFEITEDYLMAAIIFLSLSYTYRAGWFIRVTVISDMLPKPFRNAYERASRLAALVVCILIVYASFGVAMKAFRTGEFSSNLLNYPLWPAYMLVPVGTALLCLRLFQYAIAPNDDH